MKCVRRLMGRLHAERTAEQGILTERLLELLDRLRSRLDDESYRWAVENAGQTEWELAIDTIRSAAINGRLVLTADEERELPTSRAARKSTAAQADPLPAAAHRRFLGCGSRVSAFVPGFAADRR